jgi:hypothetical protein
VSESTLRAVSQTAWKVTGEVLTELEQIEQRLTQLRDRLGAVNRAHDAGVVELPDEPYDDRD